MNNKVKRALKAVVKSANNDDVIMELNAVHRDGVDPVRLGSTLLKFKLGNIDMSNIKGALFGIGKREWINFSCDTFSGSNLEIMRLRYCKDNEGKSYLHGVMYPFDKAERIKLAFRDGNKVYARKLQKKYGQAITFNVEFAIPEIRSALESYSTFMYKNDNTSVKTSNDSPREILRLR